MKASTSESGLWAMLDLLNGDAWGSHDAFVLRRGERWKRCGEFMSFALRGEGVARFRGRGLGLTPGALESAGRYRLQR